MNDFSVTVLAVGDEGDVSSLGTAQVTAADRQAACNAARDEFWDQRLDAAGYRAEYRVEQGTLKNTRKRGSEMAELLKMRVADYIPYDKAVQLIAALEANGICASIIPGGIGVYPSAHQEKAALEICAGFNTTLTSGMTLEEQRVLDRPAYERRLAAAGVDIGENRPG